MEVFKNSLVKTGQNNAIISMSGIENISVGPPPLYGGSAETLNPEELFVASINSCIMLVFYYFAEKNSLDISEYNSQAAGTVEKTKNGLRFTKVTIEASDKLKDSEQKEKIQEIAALAEKYCLVSNSVSCPVEYSVGLI